MLRIRVKIPLMTDVGSHSFSIAPYYLQFSASGGSIPICWVSLLGSYCNLRHCVVTQHLESDPDLLGDGIMIFPPTISTFFTSYSTSFAILSGMNLSAMKENERADTMEPQFPGGWRTKIPEFSPNSLILLIEKKLPLFVFLHRTIFPADHPIFSGLLNPQSCAYTLASLVEQPSPSHHLSTCIKNYASP